MKNSQINDNSEYLNVNASRVFTSYSRSDESIVGPIVSIIRAVGVSVFQDVDSILPGQLWRAVIEESLENSAAVLVFWCQHSEASSEVHKEWQRGINLNKDIIPVIMDNTSLPQQLAEFQGVDLRAVVGEHMQDSKADDAELLSDIALIHADDLDTKQAVLAAKKIIAFVKSRAQWQKNEQSDHSKEFTPSSDPYRAIRIREVYFTRVIEQIKRLWSVNQLIRDINVVSDDLLRCIREESDCFQVQYLHYNRLKRIAKQLLSIMEGRRKLQGDHGSHGYIMQKFLEYHALNLETYHVKNFVNCCRIIIQSSEYPLNEKSFLQALHSPQISDSVVLLNECSLLIGKLLVNNMYKIFDAIETENKQSIDPIQEIQHFVGSLEKRLWRPDS